MKRSLDVLKKIMLEIEEKDQLNFSLDKDENAIEHGHFTLLSEEGYVIGKPYASKGIYVAANPARLTMKGHDYLDSIRNKSTSSMF